MSQVATEVFGFEKLEVWRRAVKFAAAIYRLTSAFPRQETFGLVNQMRRAAVSVAANVAEGNSRSTGKDKARFVEIAYGSMSEVATMLRISEEVGYATVSDLAQLRSEAAEISRMLSGLKRSVLR